LGLVNKSKRSYLLKSKRGKSRLLDEYCQTTDLNRSYVIGKSGLVKKFIGDMKKSRLLIREQEN